MGESSCSGAIVGNRYEQAKDCSCSVLTQETTLGKPEIKRKVLHEVTTRREITTRPLCEYNVTGRFSICKKVVTYWPQRLEEYNDSSLVLNTQLGKRWCVTKRPRSSQKSEKGHTSLQLYKRTCGDIWGRGGHGLCWGQANHGPD